MPGEAAVPAAALLRFDHIDFLGSYTFPTELAAQTLRPLRDPAQEP
ncbi:hypothetical protein HFP72_32015 [Nocardiopsis sp. ARC36]